MSSGCYIKCDGCGVELGGQDVTKNPEPPLGPSWIYGGELRKRARERGWKWRPAAPNAHFMDNGSDYCPSCTPPAKSE
jgi:hypothetical protein